MAPTRQAVAGVIPVGPVRAVTGPGVERMDTSNPLDLCLDDATFRAYALAAELAMVLEDGRHIPTVDCRCMALALAVTAPLVFYRALRRQGLDAVRFVDVLSEFLPAAEDLLAERWVFDPDDHPATVLTIAPDLAGVFRAAGATDRATSIDVVADALLRFASPGHAGGECPIRRSRLAGQRLDLW